MSKNSFVALLFLSLSSSVVNAQTQAIVIPKASYVELQKFRHDGRALPSKYVEEFPQLIHKKIMSDADKFVKSLNGTCRDAIRITFDARVTNNQDPTVVNFENGLVKVEAAKCFGPVAPQALIEINSQLDFKKNAFSTLDNVSEKGNENCEWTSAPGVGKSHYCYVNIFTEKSDDVQTQVNFLIFNNAKYDAPVYFREALVSSRRMGSSTLFYAESYVRATTLSSFTKFFAKGFIQNSQAEFFKVMESSAYSKRNNR